jgi:hypothetical protein
MPVSLPDRMLCSALASHQRFVAGAALLCAAAICLASPAQASGRSAQAQGQATATIARPLAVSAIDDLDFGMVSSTGPGTVAVAAIGGPATFGGNAREACRGLSVCPAAHPARFSVSGEPSRNYRIDLPDRLALSDPEQPRAAGGLFAARLVVRSDSRPAAGAAGNLGLQGADSFAIGGTLEIAAALPPGHYAVSVPVSVTYD